jgi:hypothetical protein
VFTSMWDAVGLDHVDDENDIGINVSSMPSPGLRRIRVGGLASHSHGVPSPNMEAKSQLFNLKKLLNMVNYH